MFIMESEGVFCGVSGTPTNYQTHCGGRLFLGDIVRIQWGTYMATEILIDFKGKKHIAGISSSCNEIIGTTDDWEVSLFKSYFDVTPNEGFTNVRNVKIIPLNENY